MTYRLIKSGESERREYLGLNHSPLFQALPQRDFSDEQKSSYYKLIREKLPQLLNFYFPIEFNDYNNTIHCNAKEFSCQEPTISEAEARSNALTWSHEVYFTWFISWECGKKQKISIPLLEADLKKSISQWIEESFKIKNFTLREKTSQKWEVKANKDKLRILIEICEKKKNDIAVSFHYHQEEEILFCHLPKISESGNFIINGHDKVVVFQSVRAPKVYFFTSPENKVYGEIIPLKGPWISFYRSEKNSRNIELKFLNNKLKVNLFDVLKAFSVELEVLKKLFNKEDLNIADYSAAKKLEVGTTLPNFLFTKNNSYFRLGKLGRRKFQQKSSILSQIENQILAEDLYDVKGKLILPEDSTLEGKNLQILKKALNEKKINSIFLPNSTNELYSLKIKSPHDKRKIITIVGTSEEITEDKIYFDLADLVCAVSLYLNLEHGLGETEKEEDKDKLENQIVRRVGDLVYNMFDVWLGIFIQELNKKYLSTISQLKKVDPLKVPSLKDFDKFIKHFFNTSALVQLQNQNNTLSQTSSLHKLIVYGEGGFKPQGVTLAARNINISHHGRYDPVETPEGQKVGLIHNLSIDAKINDYGQVVTSYYVVKEGIVTPELIYLSSEEEWDKYITHPNIKINEKNKILDSTVSALYRGEFVQISPKKINYIASSFYQMNSLASATIPFFQHNDAARMLMATGMQKQALPLIHNEEPLIASGIEVSLVENSSLTIRAGKEGQVDYVDSQQITIKESNQEKKVYKLPQLVVSNKNVLNFSRPLVKKGEKVAKNQIIANGDYTRNGELALGVNLRVAYLSWYGYNFEDGIIISERLVKEDILTSLFVRVHTITLYNTKNGPEVFTAASPSYFKKKTSANLDKDGLVKIGSEVKGGDILVGKLTPESTPRQETEEEALLRSIFGQKSQNYTDSSLYMPAEEQGIVYDIRRKKLSGKKNELELVEIYVAEARKIEVGDKLTTRFGNKGVVTKIVPETEMPFDEEGRVTDIIFSPLGVPSRMNFGQLLETILATAAQKLNTKLLVRPFSTLPLEAVKKIVQEAGIKNFGTQKLFDGRTGLPFSHEVYAGYIYTIKLNHMVADKFHARNVGPYSSIYQQPLKGRAQKGGQRVGEMEAWALEAHGAAYNLMEMMSAKSDDIYKRRLIHHRLLFDDGSIDLRSSQSESFNLLLQYLHGIGFDLQATDYQGQEIDFYKYFSKN